jgi:hypothetical protein
MRGEKKGFDNVESRQRLWSARDEQDRIRRRIDRLDAALVSELTARLKDVDASLMHAREALGYLVDVRGMRGRV